MKIAAFLIAFCTALCVFAQDMDELKVIAKDVNDELREGAAAHGRKQYTMPEYNIVIDASSEVNASANGNTVHLNSALVEILKRDPGELAFVIAHEVGHIEDVHCHERGNAEKLSGAALKRMCEQSADTIAVQYMMAAGFNPFEAAGVMGKLMMAGGRTSVLGIFIGRFTMDHPVDIDRVRNVANVASFVCHERPEICE